MPPTDPASPRSAATPPRLDRVPLPRGFASVDALDDFLATPTPALIDDLARAPGDILILGVAGKMGPTLARLAKNAAPERRVIGVARFSDKAVQARGDAAGPEAIAAAPLGQQIGRVGHALHATRDDEAVAASEREFVRRDHHRLHARAAHL